MRTSALLTLQNLIFDRGIIDKTNMYEAVNYSGTQIAIWVKYSFPIYHNNFSKKDCIVAKRSQAKIRQLVGKFIHNSQIRQRAVMNRNSVMET